MGYFFGCFGRRKDRRRRRSSKKASPLNSPCQTPHSHELHKPPPPRFSCSPENLSLQQQATGGSGSAPALRENHQKSNRVCRKKKVTFDLNVKTYEPVVNDDDLEHSVDVVDGCIIDEKELENVVNKLKSNSYSFPLNHRYQNCESIDENNVGDEKEDEYWDCNSDEQDDQAGIEEDEEGQNNSFFSMSIKKEEGTFHEASGPRMMHMSYNDKQPTISAKSNPHDHGQYAHSVLNSVENVSICKEFKVHADSMKNPEKENINTVMNNEIVSNSRPSLWFGKPKESTNSKPPPKLSTHQEMSLDTNIANWLKSDNSTTEGPQECYSYHSHPSLRREEQPILGALTLEDIRQSSYALSRRKSVCKNPDDIPILGTVGSYWNCQNKSI